MLVLYSSVDKYSNAILSVYFHFIFNCINKRMLGADEKLTVGIKAAATSSDIMTIPNV